MTFKPIALDDPQITIAGALDVKRSPERISIRRLPSWTQAQSPEPAFDLMVGMGSGVRICLTTDADALELDVLVTGLQFAGSLRRAVVFDVCVNAKLMAREVTEAGHTIVVDGADVRFVAGAPSTVRFTGLGTNTKRLEVFLPHAALTEIHAVRLPVAAQIVTRPQTAIRWGHYGSSISHGMEAAGPSETWPAIVAHRAGVNLTNLGFAGQCHLDGFVARTLRDSPFDAISMKLGANVVASDSLRRRTFASAVHSMLDTILDGKPETPVLLISPIYCPLLEETPGPVRRTDAGGYVGQLRETALQDGALTLVGLREILRDLVSRRRTEGDAHLHYLDGLSLFGSVDTIMMPDQLHPDADGHRVMASRFAPAAFEKSGAFGFLIQH